MQSTAIATHDTQQHTPAARPADDTLLLLDEVCALTRRPEATERYLRHRGETAYLFRMGRRLVAWKSDVVADIEAHRLADQAQA